MHKDIPWSYAPYKPYFHETGDIYICRVAPSEDAIHLEWLPVADTYEIYYRLRDTGDFALYDTTEDCAFSGRYLCSPSLVRHTDGGKTFPEHTVLLRGAGRPNQPGVHKNPQNIMYYNGRIYETLEWGAWACGYHAPMVMSAAEDADLMDAASWLLRPL